MCGEEPPDWLHGMRQEGTATEWCMMDGWVGKKGEVGGWRNVLLLRVGTTGWRWVVRVRRRRSEEGVAPPRAITERVDSHTDSTVNSASGKKRTFLASIPVIHNSTVRKETVVHAKASSPLPFSNPFRQLQNWFTPYAFYKFLTLRQFN